MAEFVNIRWDCFNIIIIVFSIIKGRKKSPCWISKEKLVNNSKPISLIVEQKEKENHNASIFLIQNYYIGHR